MKRIKHIILIILLLSVGFADRQPMKAVTASDSVVDTTVDSFSVKMDSAIRQFVSGGRYILTTSAFLLAMWSKKPGS